MTEDGGFVEVQGTAENGATYNRAQLEEMLRLGEGGIKKLFEIQRKALESAK